MFVVTLPPSAAFDPLIFAKTSKLAGADILEIRGDTTPDVAAFDSPLPLLLALRGADTGMIERLRPSYVDLELHEQDIELPLWVTRIASFHDYECTPTLVQLRSIVTNLLEHKPAIVKIATTINSYADLAILDALQREISQDGTVKTVILGMGPLSRMQRLLSPSRDALTYTCINEGEQAAPGQISLVEYRSFSYLKQPRLFGLLGGQAIQNSLSPLIHNILFKAHGIDALYSIFPTEDLRDAFTHLSAIGVEGFSVTAPWKQDVMNFADDTQEIAKRLQSCNTLIKSDDSWTAYNTDVPGIIAGYPFLKDSTSAAIVGSGGVVPSVIDACRQSGIKQIRIFARNGQAGGELAQRFGVEFDRIESLKNASFDVVFCTVSDDIDIPLPKGKAGAHAIDLRYLKSTKFLARAKIHGFQTHNGLPLLLSQALLQFTMFTGVTPREDVVSSLLTSLSTHGKQ